MPNLPLDILELVLLALSLACAVYWGVVFTHMVVTSSRLPTARDGIAMADADAPTERVCVVVPAHNEAANIATLIRSLKNQDYDRLRVVLALDRCTDDTLGVALEAIGGDHRFEIIEIDECPEDWAGKVHAVHSGVTRSKGAKNADVLIFSDADTWFDPSCVRATLALARDRGLDLLSLLSTLEHSSWFERVAQPAASFELARQFPLMSVNRSDELRRPFANGQFMLFRAGVYHAIGGHTLVKDELLEDIAFSVWIKYLGYKGGLFTGAGVLRCGMYPSYAAFRKGWKRIYTESAQREVGRLKRYAWRVPFVNAVLPVASALCVVLSVTLGDTLTMIGGGALGAIGLFAWALAVGKLHAVSGAPIRDVPLFVWGSVVVGSIFREAARDLEDGTPTQWGGRSYTRRAVGGG